MRTEAEIKDVLIRVLNGEINHPIGYHIIAIRTLAWVLDIEVKQCTRRRPKSLKKPVALDHFAV